MAKNRKARTPGRIMKLSDWRAACALPVWEKDLLIESVCGIDKLHIVSDGASFLLSDQQLEKLERLQERRLRGEPLQYLLGFAYFLGRRFRICPGVLIPRPDTEFLVAEAAAWIQRKDGPRCRVLDLCTGSGCVGISIIKELERDRSARVELVMSDVSGQALAAAKENCALLDGRCEKISFIKSDYFASLPSLPFDVIVSNPPYIKTDDLAGLACEVRDHEPRIALDGGADGLMAYRKIAAGILQFLKEDGHLFLEVGFDEAEQVKALFEPKFSQIDIVRDLNGFGRVLHLYNA